jgi:hypothetical protein
MDPGSSPYKTVKKKSFSIKQVISRIAEKPRSFLLSGANKTKERIRDRVGCLALTLRINEYVHWCG